MSARIFVTASMLLGIGAAAQAAGTDALQPDVRQCRSIVASLHADKPGQMRVFAADGSEFTAGQAQWMRAQLHLADLDQSAGRGTEASRRVADVAELIRQHHRA